MSKIFFEHVVYGDEFPVVFENLRLFDLYHECFSKPPYQEEFNQQQVLEVFTQYSSHGILILGKASKNECVAFAAAVPIQEEREVYRIASEYGLDVEKYWYAADLGVSSEYRRNGIGSMIVKELISRIPSNRILMRTQENNIASQKCNTGIGFHIIKGMKQIVQAPRTTGVSSGDNRIFLEFWKK